MGLKNLSLQAYAAKLKRFSPASWSYFKGDEYDSCETYVLFGEEVDAEILKEEGEYSLSIFGNDIRKYFELNFEELEGEGAGTIKELWDYLECRRHFYVRRGKSVGIIEQLKPRFTSYEENKETE